MVTTCILIKNIFGGENVKYQRKKWKYNLVLKTVVHLPLSLSLLSFMEKILAMSFTNNKVRMRKHLFDCFEKLIVMPFPTQLNSCITKVFLISIKMPIVKNVIAK